MHRKVLIPALAATLVLLATPLLAETIFRWVDGNGQTHYSDVPTDGAEQVELDAAQTFSAPAVGRSSSSSDQALNEPTKGYESLEIVSPSQEETIWNTGGVITVAVQPSPPLKEGHSINIYYDGKRIKSKAPSATSVQLSEVYRGKHRISAEIQNVSGAVLVAASPVTFFYKAETNPVSYKQNGSNQGGSDQDTIPTHLGVPKIPQRILPKRRPTPP